MTFDHTIANEILERRPETPDEVLDELPRNSVVCALGMDIELRVPVRTVDLVAGDRFLLCTDGLTTAVSTATLWTTLREPEPPSVVVSELLSHALAARSHDNISILVADCRERIVDEQVDTRRYNEVPLQAPTAPEIDLDEGPSSAELVGPEILAPSGVEAVEEWGGDSEMPTAPLPEARQRELFRAELLEAPGPPEEPASVDPSDFEILDGDPLDLPDFPPPEEEPATEGGSDK